MYRIVIAKVSTKALKKARLHNLICLQQYRFASDKPNLCPPKKKHSSGTIYAIGFVAIVGGATITYAKSDPEFRSLLNTYIPYSDDFIKFLYQEEKTYIESFQALALYLKAAFVGLFVKKKPKGTDIPVEPKPYCPPPPAFSSLTDSAKYDPKYNEIRVEQKSEGTTNVTIGGEIKEPEEITPTHPKNILELEEKMGKSAADTVKAYNEAVFALKNYTKDVEIIIEDSIDKTDPEIWNTIRKKTKAKDYTLRTAQNLYKETKKNIKKLEEILDNPRCGAPELVIKQSRVNIDKIHDDLKKAKEELDEITKSLNLTDKYWNKVEHARNHFIDEIQTLFPGVDITDRKLNLQGGELDLFILHAFSNVLFYQKELCKLQILEEEKIRIALETARRGNKDILTDAQIDQLVEKERKNLALEFQKKCLALRADSEKELRQQLKLQSETFADHLQDALEVKTKELERNFARDLDEKVTAERCKFKLQLSDMAGRVKGMDQVFKARTEADLIKKQSQVLWSACQSLFRALRAGCPGLPWTEQLRPLNPELTAVRNAAADHDELVKVVLSGIPNIARERGVFPEDALRERFFKVEKVARELALIPEMGARLPMHALSYIHSLLLVKAASPIPQSELADSEVNFTGLSTNEILQRARYWVDRGDFAQALRYMNLLDGASRKMASQWMDETRLLLEIQQATNVLLAHASANGLAFL